MTPARPRLSLCLIMKDEERMLPHCLASVRGLVDEMIVCDTGSSDKSVQVALAAGAKVIHFPWVNDFAAARNYSIDAATGDWVLQLDADERLGPTAAAVIRATLVANDLDCAFLPLHDASRLDATADEVLSGAARLHPPTLLPRLFRRDPGARYSSPIHETLDDWITAPGRRYRGIHAPIVHYGAVPELRVGLQKSDRNLRLLRARVESNPDDIRSRAYFAHELFGAGQQVAARAQIWRAWQDSVAEHAAGRRRPERAAADAEFLGGWGALVHLEAGELEAARSMVDRAFAWGGDHPNLYFARGVIHERTAYAREEEERRPLLEAARRDLSLALCCTGRTYSVAVNPGADGFQALLRRGTVGLALGEPGPALADFQAVLHDHPNLVEARLGAAEATLLLGRPREALSMLKPLLGPGNADGWLLAALSVEAMGAPSQAAPWRALAAQIHEKRPLLPHRRARLGPASSRLGPRAG